MVDMPREYSAPKEVSVLCIGQKLVKQLTAQPVFGKSDQQFKGLDTLFSASIAADRGGNERGVNVAKRPGYIKKGFLPGMNARMFNDVWLCWSFQANFMCSSVL